LKKLFEMFSLFAACCLLAHGRVTVPTVESANEKIYGVNLGGWFVMEPWITPNLFRKANEGVPRLSDNAYSIVDEHTWRNRSAGTHDRKEMLIDHWENFITKEMLEVLADGGITHLRVPVGYWYFSSFEGGENTAFALYDDIYPKALAKFKQLVNEWCKELGLKVMVDLHAVPGSQNGFDNSGRRGPIDLLKDDYFNQWVTALTKMSSWVMENINREQLWGIEIMNEPAGYDAFMWTAINDKINPQGYPAVRKATSDVPVIFQTGFHAPKDQASYTKPKYENVWFDHHNYQCFGNDWNELSTEPSGWGNHLTHSCNMKELYTGIPLETVTGEFSLAVTDCTIFLDGGMNAGCDMMNDPNCEYASWAAQHNHNSTCHFYNKPYTEMSEDYKKFLNQFIRAQWDAFEVAQGWFFWTAHTENNHAPAWDYVLGLQQGWIPKQSERKNMASFCDSEDYTNSKFVQAIKNRVDTSGFQTSKRQ